MRRRTGSPRTSKACTVTKVQGMTYISQALKAPSAPPADTIHIRIPIEGAHIGLLAEGAGSSGQVADRWIYTDSAAARCNRRGRGLP